MTRLALIGVSVRALAESAALTGEEVVAADFFGDRDLAQACESYAVGRDLGLPLTAQGLAAAARRLRADAVLQKRAMGNGKIEFAWDSVIEEVIGGDFVEGVRIRDVKSPEKKKTVPAEGVFIFIGLIPNTDILRGVAELSDAGYVIVDCGMRTSVKGIFACGDCIDKTLRQVVTACGDGATRR